MAKRPYWLIPLFLFMLLSRLLFLGGAPFLLPLGEDVVALGGKPYHHDESLFAFYAWTQATDGNYEHHALLHGPLLIQGCALFLKAAIVLGVPEQAETYARLFPALCAIVLPLLLWGLRRFLTPPGALFAAALIALSPALWYYGRFCRNESPFLLMALLVVLCVARAWRSTRPAGWICGAFLAMAALVGFKENSLFLLFNGAFFLALLLAHAVWAQQVDPRRFERCMTPAHRWTAALRRYYPVFLAGAALGFLLLEVVYSNFFRWDTNFLQKYLSILSYWAGQHREHRLYGPFHYYLPFWMLYGSLSFGVVLWLGLRGPRRFSRPWHLSLSLFAGMAGLWVGHAAPGLLDSLHMSAPWHLALATLAGWWTVLGAWMNLSRKKLFRSWLILWTGFSFLQYNYAGEKVPWLALHTILPATLLAAQTLGEWWRKAPAKGLRRKCLLAGLLLALGWNGFQGARVCFLWPHDPRDLLVYTHTQPPIHRLGRALYRADSAPDRTGIPLIQGEATWPLIFYLRDAEYRFAPEGIKPSLEGISVVVCDTDYGNTWDELNRQFTLDYIPMRTGWIPERLWLLPAGWMHRLWIFDPAWHAPENAPPVKNTGWSAWRALARYVALREMWGDPNTTALPLEVLFGTRKVESP